MLSVSQQQMPGCFPCLTEKAVSGIIQPMPNVTLTDPIGRTFVLADHTWDGHIRRGHPDMEPHRALVEQAVTTPIGIWVSSSNADARTCYGAGPRASLLVAVIVDVPLGIVKTAYLTRNMTGMAQEWTP